MPQIIQNLQRIAVFFAYCALGILEFYNPKAFWNQVHFEHFITPVQTFFGYQSIAIRVFLGKRIWLECVTFDQANYSDQKWDAALPWPMPLLIGDRGSPCRPPADPGQAVHCPVAPDLWVPLHGSWIVFGCGSGSCCNRPRLQHHHCLATWTLLNRLMKQLGYPRFFLFRSIAWFGQWQYLCNPLKVYFPTFGYEWPTELQMNSADPFGFVAIFCF